MSMTNEYQTKSWWVGTGVKNYTSYVPILRKLGSGQGDWNPVPYAKMIKDVINISMDSNSFKVDTIADNIIQQIGIVSKRESIDINPIMVEINESGFKESNFNETIPMVLGKMMEIWDDVNAKRLKAVSKSYPKLAIEDSNLVLMNKIIEIVGASSFYDKKHVIVPNDVFRALVYRSDSRSSDILWSMLNESLQQFNADVRHCQYVDDIFVIVEPLMAEYEGQTPRVFNIGTDPKTGGNWVNFVMSNSDFKAREPLAVQVYPVEVTPALFKNALGNQAAVKPAGPPSKS